MGKPKGQLILDGSPILCYLLDQFHWPGPTLLVTAPAGDDGSPSTQHPPGSERFDREVSDPVSGLGPMRGVLTALENATTSWVIVTTVDMPGLRRGCLDDLLRLGDALPTLHGLMLSRSQPDGEVCCEPFPSLYHTAATATLRTQLATGSRGMHRLLQHAGFVLQPAPPDWSTVTWCNLNHPADLAAYRASGSP